MPVRFKDHRKDPRSRIPGFQHAEIEFTGPDGTVHKLRLIGLSVSGGSFQLPGRSPGLEVGTAVAGGVIRFDKREVQVNFIIRHVTHGDGKAYEYGVEICTMSHQNRNEMAGLILMLELHRQMT